MGFEAALGEVTNAIGVLNSEADVIDRDMGVFVGGSVVLAGSAVAIPAAGTAVSGYYGGSAAVYYSTTSVLGGVSGYGIGYGRDALLGITDERTWGTVTGDVVGGALLGPGASGLVERFGVMKVGAVSGVLSNTAAQITDIRLGSQQSLNMGDLASSGLGGAFGGKLGSLVPIIRIPGVTAGRNNFASVFQSVETRIANGLASRYTIGVGFKGAVGRSVGGLSAQAGDTVGTGVMENSLIWRAK